MSSHRAHNAAAVAVGVVSGVVTKPCCYMLRAEAKTAQSVSVENTFNDEGTQYNVKDSLETPSAG